MAENPTEDEKLRLLREEVVNLRVEGPEVISKLLELERQFMNENLKNAEYLMSPVQKLEKRPDRWVPSADSFEIPESKCTLEMQIELNTRCDELLETIEMLKQAKKN